MPPRRLPLFPPRRHSRRSRQRRMILAFASKALSKSLDPDLMFAVVAGETRDRRKGKMLSISISGSLLLSIEKVVDSRTAG